MPTNDYIPPRDAEFRNWAEAFARGIAAAPARFMLTPAEAAGITQAVDRFIAALAVSSDPATRTRGTIADKDDARSIAESLCRAYAIDIKHNRGIEDGDKINVGVRPINPNRRRISVPRTSPALAILGNTPGVQVLRYRDPFAGSGVRARPFGASALELFLALTEESALERAMRRRAAESAAGGEAAGAGAGQDAAAAGGEGGGGGHGIGGDGHGHSRAGKKAAPVENAKYLGQFTRNPMTVRFEPKHDGLVATYYGRWASRRGEVGPWSLPVSLRVAA